MGFSFFIPAACFKRSSRSTPDSIPEDTVVSPQNSAKSTSIKYVTNTDTECSSGSEDEFDDFDFDSGISSRSTPHKNSPLKISRRESLLPPIQLGLKV